MNQSNKIVTWLKTQIQGMITGLILLIIPSHTRRAIFACSLAARFFPSDAQLRAKLAENLVKNLNLVCAYNSMLAPMSWSQFIWRRLPELEVTAHCSIRSLSKTAGTVLQLAPISLLYANPRLMQEDVLATLKTVSEMRTI